MALNPFFSLLTQLANEQIADNQRLWFWSAPLNGALSYSSRDSLSKRQKNNLF